LLALKPSPSRGGFGWGWCCTCPQCFQNHFQHSIRVFEDVIVPEPQDGEPVAFQRRCPPRVVRCRIRMLATVQLNHEFSFEAGEIKDEIQERMLSPELASLQLPAAQLPPKQGL